MNNISQDQQTEAVLLVDAANAFNAVQITESYSEGTSKAAAYADDLTAAGCIPGLKHWWDQFICLFTTLFNVGHIRVTRLIKTNLTNTDIIDKNFKIFDMQHKNSESFVHDSISV